MQREYVWTSTLNFKGNILCLVLTFIQALNQAWSTVTLFLTRLLVVGYLHDRMEGTFFSAEA
jgi:hypothetical protein